MNTAEKLSKHLTQILSGDAWYGPNVYDILAQVSFEAAYEKPPGSIHNIAEIVLHMIAWTEEVMDRMNGLTAGIPSSGDWPDTGAPDEQNRGPGRPGPVRRPAAAPPARQPARTAIPG